MRKAFVAVLLLALGATTASAAAEGVATSDPGVVRALRGGSSAGGSELGTAGRGSLSATADTVWIGHGNAGPGHLEAWDASAARATP